MAINYITPITDRTWDDVQYARTHQSDLSHHNKGAWNYEDCNRVCNNLKYAANWMYATGFLSQPYTMQIKTDWTEDDIITIEQLNRMIVNNMNNLKSYSRNDLDWYNISSIANMNYSLANAIEKNIDQLATQLPPAPELYELIVEHGTGSGYYEARTVVDIRANTPQPGLVFDHWSGNHLENIGNPTAAITTYEMPNDNVTLTANYSSTVPHTLTVVTYTNQTEYTLYMGSVVSVEADPAPQGKVFHHWETVPEGYDRNFYEQAATTNFTMPNEDITITAIYVQTGKKELRVTNGSGSGLYDYNTYVAVSPNLPAGATFTSWTGDTQYLTSSATQAYNSVKIPDQAVIRITANWTIPPTPPVTDVSLTVVNGTITSSGQTSGTFTQGTNVGVTADPAPEGSVFTGWTKSGGGSISNSGSINATVTMGASSTTVTATYRTLTYYDLTVITNDGTTTVSKESQEYFSINANPAPSGYVFSHWTGDTSGLGNVYSASTGATMGNSNRTITAVYRPLEYHTLTIITGSGTVTQEKERDEYFSVNASPEPTGYVFDSWSGDTNSYKPPTVSSGYTFNTTAISTGTYMGSADRTITALYRSINSHTLTVKQPSGDVLYNSPEFSTQQITAEVPEGKRFTGWSLSGSGSISTYSGQTTTYTFGNGDAILTPNYVNRWTVTVSQGTIAGQASVTLDQGGTYSLNCRSLEIWERFDGWTISGPGTISNPAATATYFTVGNGNATITANISQYPDTTLTVYYQDPDTSEITLVSEETYTYGTAIPKLEAPVAPDKTTFLTWLGGEQDLALLSPSALASTVRIASLTRDVTITATYFYPEEPDYYTLTIFDGTPQTGSYATGSQVPIRANSPNEGWEFYKWFGDTQFLVNQGGLDDPNNSVIIPKQAVTLYAKFKMIGELPLFRVSVENGTASGTYITGEGTEESPEIVHEESGVYIDVPAGTTVTLTADADLVGWVFDYWDGNFEEAGVVDISTTRTPTSFTMVENDLNITMVRRELDTYTVYTTNATGPGTTYPGRYPIAGNLRNTEDIHYLFNNWDCVDAEEEDCIESIENPNQLETYVTLVDKDLWIAANYTSYYRLTVINGQDTGEGYYYEGENISTVYANTPSPESKMIFDHWEDPNGVCVNIYDPTPAIVMVDSPSTITAIFTSTDTRGNSIISAGTDLNTNTIYRSTSALINGIYAVGAIVIDRDGCIGTITQVDPDHNDDTDDFRTERLFYGGNF